MNKIKLFISLAVVLGLLYACNDQSSEPPNNFNTQNILKQGAPEATQAAMYEITLENLSPATGAGSSQPFSPPIIVTHKPPLRLFKVNSYASDELRQVAEDAVNGPMVDLLNQSGDVYQVVQGSNVIFPGSTETFYIEADRKMHKLSLVTMLVNTNDGFTGVDKLNLPQEGSMEIYLRAYDAGTEQNTESALNIPGPCCGSHLVRVPTHERINYHQGIIGIGDLGPQIYGWNEPVAKLTITKVN